MKKICAALLLVFAMATAHAKADNYYGGKIWSYACNAGTGNFVGQVDTTGPNTGQACGLPVTGGNSGTLSLGGAVSASPPSYTAGTTQPLSLGLSGLLRVDGSGVTQPVSAAALPLPTGAATSANQSSEIAALGAPSDTPWTSGSGSLVALLKALYAAMVAATPAGEQHVGEVGGNVIGVAVSQTVTASSAYASGNAVGGLITIANAGRVTGGSGYVQNIAIQMLSAQTAEIDVVLFRANPTASTCTDKTAFAVASADIAKVIPPVQVTQWMALGTPSVGSAGNLAISYQLPSGTSLYACLVTRGTPTYASTSDVSVLFGLVRN